MWGQQRLSCLVWTDWRSTVAQVTLHFNHAYGSNVSHHSDRSKGPFKGMTTVHCWKPLQWVHECTHCSANWTRCGKMTVGGWSLMLWAMFCQVTMGPAIYVDINLTLATYLNIANLGTLLSGNAIPDCNSLFQQNNAPFHIVPEWLEEHEFKVFPWPPNSSSPINCSFTSQLKGFEGSIANVLRPDTTGHLRRSSWIHGSASVLCSVGTLGQAALDRWLLVVSALAHCSLKDLQVWNIPQ